MKRTRISPITLTLCLALLGAACGSSESSGGSSATDAAATTTTAEAATTTSEAATTTTTVPPTTAAPSTTSTTTTTTIAPTTTTTAPAPATTAPPTTSAPAPAPTVEYCDSAGPLSGGAALMSAITVDMLGDGSADDLVEAYAVGDVTLLRVTTGDGVVSEIVNSTIDGTFRPLGIAPVFPGDSAELFAVIGEGSAAVEIGVFGLDFADCLFSYTWDGTSDDFTMLIRPGSPVRSDATCFDGGILISNADRQADGTWAAYSAAHELASPWTIRYMGASDDYDEGLTEAEIGTFEFDCFGLTP